MQGSTDMSSEQRTVQIRVADGGISGTMFSPGRRLPGFLLIHGWGGSQENYMSHAREVAALGCICLTFDLRGHAETEPLRKHITPQQNMADVLAAYDALAGHPAVDLNAIGVVGSSYGGYLAVHLTRERAVRWLALRVPALYKDEHWTAAKAEIDRTELERFRSEVVAPDRNRALTACAKFRGDVLVVESERDGFVPHSVITSYRAAFHHSKSLTYRRIDGADHSLTEVEHQRAYSSILVSWAAEMVLGAREGSGVLADVRGTPQALPTSEA
jgi:pimeloyl-ACP methyl ester carboxylesterase